MSVAIRVACILLVPLSAATAWGQSPDAGPQPFPDRVRTAWENAGAVTGWLVETPFGLRFRAGAGPGMPGELPAFRWNDWQDNVTAKLPAPGQVFGLDISENRITDAGLKELARFKQL